MSVKVNLLPQEQTARQAAARQRNAVLAAGLVLLLLLAGANWSQLQTLSRAEDDEIVAQGRVTQLEADRAELQEFADLDSQLDEARETVSTGLSTEMSFAGLLQDVALVTPSDTALTNVDITRIEGAAPDGETARPVIARVIVDGETLAGPSPGLERALLEFDKVAAFFDPHVTASAADEEDPDVSIFTFEVEVGQEAYTHRYRDGLPEGLR